MWTNQLSNRKISGSRTGSPGEIDMGPIP
jgi:hypothetical protein